MPLSRFALRFAYRLIQKEMTNMASLQAISKTAFSTSCIATCSYSARGGIMSNPRNDFVKELHKHEEGKLAARPLGSQNIRNHRRWRAPSAQATRKRADARGEKLTALSDEHRKIVQRYEKKLDLCKKDTTKAMRERLDFSTNILGINQNLRSGSIKDGTVNALALDYKTKFPNEVILVQVGDFYEAMGYDAVMLVECANLNPTGGIFSEAIPKAGFPLQNLRQTLRDLNNKNISAAIVKEVKGPTKANERKERFLSGHSHRGSPYVYGMARDEGDIEFPPDPVAILGVARTSKGFTLISVFELTLSYKLEEGLTEEGILAKMRSIDTAGGFLHESLKIDVTGVYKWGGRLQSECMSRQYDEYFGDSLHGLLQKVRQHYALDEDVVFREMESPPGNRPRPLYTSAASQIGLQATVGVPSLLQVLLPTEANKLCQIYLRELLLNPPPSNVADAIQGACRLLSTVHDSLPEFHTEPASKLVKLLRAGEVNHVELRKIRLIAENLVYMFEVEALEPIGEHLLLPTWLSSGIHMDKKQLVSDCAAVAASIADVLAEEAPLHPLSMASMCSKGLDGVEPLQEFYMEEEASWRGRVKSKHVEDAYARVQSAATDLNDAVEEWFIPIVQWIRSGPRARSRKVEILYSKDQGGVYLKGKSLRPTAEEMRLGAQPGVKQAAALEHALERGNRTPRKVGEDWWTCPEVDEALTRYREACEAACEAVIAVLKKLASELEDKLDSIITAANFSVIACTLIQHTEETQRRGWVRATLMDEGSTARKVDSNEYRPLRQLQLEGLVPYWLNLTGSQVVANSVSLNSMCLLTGPNGGGKSSILRSVYAAALLANCGLCVPAKEARLPRFDAFFLRMMAADSPADGKSSFQMEMSELSTILAEASGRSLVLVDELCKGTEVGKGTGLVAASLEELASRACIGIISTHLHGLLDIKLKAGNVARKAMGTIVKNGQTEPTWTLVDGECRESLAFSVALKEGVPLRLVKRGEEVYRELLEITLGKGGAPIRHVNDGNDMTGCWNGREVATATSLSTNGRGGTLDGSGVEGRMTPALPDVARHRSWPSIHEETPVTGGEGDTRDEEDAATRLESSADGGFVESLVINGHEHNHRVFDQQHTVSDALPDDSTSSFDPAEIGIKTKRGQGRETKEGAQLANGRLWQHSSMESSPGDRAADLKSMVAEACSAVIGHEVSIAVLKAGELPPSEAAKVSHVYIVRLQNGQYHVGIAPNIRRRVQVYQDEPRLQGMVFWCVPIGDNRTVEPLQNELVVRLQAAGFPAVKVSSRARQSRGSLPPF